VGTSVDKKTLKLDEPTPGPRQTATLVPALAAADRYYLMVFHGDTSSTYQLPRTGEVLMGRAIEAHLTLADHAVSRRHATITMSDGEARIADLGSQNGTKLNGERITGTRSLVSGDCITVCSVTLVYHASSRVQAPRPAVDFVPFRQRAAEEIERSLRYHRELTLLALNPGLIAADRPRVEKALEGHTRLIDVVTWSSGDQLLVLMPETGSDSARGVAQRLMSAVLSTAPATRAGYATCPKDGCDVDTVLAGARAACQEAAPGKVAAATETFRTLTLGGRSVIVADPAMTRLYALIERLAASELPVLVSGETGTGKELAASALHHGSARKRGPLVALNCAALHENLLESELFGHEKGAFSGALAAKPGLLESAAGGTVFLDEIGELPAAAQAKLLRVLETKRVTRLGDVREREIDIRIVAATNRKLDDEVKRGVFRQDLFFRLSGAMIWLPPLRDRPRELPILAQSFLAEACASLDRAPMAISASAMRRLLTYSWPGNVRELKNVMDYVAATVPESGLEAWHLQERLGDAGAEISTTEESLPPALAPATPPTGAAATFRPIEDEIRELERSRMEGALAATGGNQTRAAELISMPLRTFVAKMKLYGLAKRAESRGR
jgi:DNA-binding NtrC family response regulator